ncbi:MAG: hydroxymethylbilane synthase [Clostridia bacterium]
MSNYFPLFIDLSSKKIIVIGAGKIATRRINSLLKFCDGFTVIAETFDENFDKSRLNLIKKSFEMSDIADLSNGDIVLALTNDHELNRRIAKHCKDKGILVNVSTDKNLCTFFFPAVIVEDEIVVGITASGKNHKKVKETSERIAKLMNKKIIIGSRESKLAVVQSEMLLNYLKDNNIPCEILTMKTTGDIILDKTLDKIGGKGLFTKELDKALIEKRSDFSVHSLKDMPMEVPKELPILGYSKREDARDVLILPKGETELKFDKPIGSSSFRRTLQLKKLFPQATFKSIRGNVLTRLEKLDDHQYGAIVLAAAGVKRLKLENRISRYFEVDEILPAGGQAIVVVQGRENEDYSYLNEFFDKQSYYMATAERAFITTLNGGCSSPIAAFSTINEQNITLQGLYYDEESKEYSKETMTASVDQAEALGINLANKMRNKGNCNG